MNRSLARGTASLLLVLARAGCAALEQELARRQPTATLESARLAGLGFESAQLVLDVRIDNPDAFALSLRELRYALHVDDSRWPPAAPAGGPRSRRVAARA